MLLYQAVAFTIHGKISWNEEFELPNGSYSVSDIQDCAIKISAHFFFNFLKRH